MFFYSFLNLITFIVISFKSIGLLIFSKWNSLRYFCVSGKFGESPSSGLEFYETSIESPSFEVSISALILSFNKDLWNVQNTREMKVNESIKEILKIHQILLYLILLMNKNWFMIVKTAELIHKLNFTCFEVLMHNYRKGGIHGFTKIIETITEVTN